MVRFLVRIVTLLYLLTGFHQVWAETVRVEVKEFDNQTMLIFYHDRRNILAPNMVGGHGRIRASKPVKVQSISRNLSRFCTSIKVDPSKHVIDFKLNNDYRFVGNIYGENLVAFKLRNINAPLPKVKPPEPRKEVAVNVAKANVETKPEVAQAPKEAIKQEVPSTKSDITVQTIDTKNVRSLIFPFSEKDVGAAIFMRGSDLWVVFDNRKDFFIPDASFIESWSQYNDVSNTVIKINLKQNFAVNVFKQRDNWVINLANKPIIAKKYLQPESVSDILVSVKQIGKMKNIVTVRDAAIGDILMIVPLLEAEIGIEKEKSMVDYKILAAAQGIAISLISDDVKITYNNNSQSLDISSRYLMPVDKEVKLSPSIAKSILPFGLTEDDKINFIKNKQILYNNIVNEEDASGTAKQEFALSKFYFKHTLFPEAFGCINNAEYHDPKSLGESGLLMKAITMIYNNKSLDARAIFSELKSRYQNDEAIFEIQLWDKYNEFLLGALPADNIGVYGNKLLDNYPDNVYWDLVLAELESFSLKKDTKSIDSLLNSLRSSSDASVNNYIKYYKGRYFCLLGQINLCQRSYEEVKQNAQNGKEYTLAELQLVKLLYDQKMLDWSSAASKLNQLRYSWRGDKIEMQLLMAMGIAYKQNNDFVNAIRIYKYIIDAFGRQSDSNFFITSQIVELYTKIFLTDAAGELDDFNIVALFYEFKEFTPIGADGDKVVLGVARRMLNLDLLEMASSLLEHQVMYRLRGTERMVTANHLALVLLMDRKPQQALKVLDETDKENFGYIEHEKRRYLKAKALIDLERYGDALSYIGDSVDEDALVLKSEILFRHQKWLEYIKFIEPTLKQKISSGDVIEGPISQEVLRLAISYSMINRISDLEYLQQHIITENAELKSIIEFLRSTNTPIDPHNLDKSLNIDQMQNFLDEYRKKLFEKDA